MTKVEKNTEKGTSSSKGIEQIFQEQRKYLNGEAKKVFLKNVNNMSFEKFNENPSNLKSDNIGTIYTSYYEDVQAKAKKLSETLSIVVGKSKPISANITNTCKELVEYLTNCNKESDQEKRRLLYSFDKFSALQKLFAAAAEFQNQNSEEFLCYDCVKKYLKEQAEVFNESIANLNAVEAKRKEYIEKWREEYYSKMTEFISNNSFITLEKIDEEYKKYRKKDTKEGKKEYEIDEENYIYNIYENLRNGVPSLLNAINEDLKKEPENGLSYNCISEMQKACENLYNCDVADIETRIEVCKKLLEAFMNASKISKKDANVSGNYAFLCREDMKKYVETQVTIIKTCVDKMEELSKKLKKKLEQINKSAGRTNEEIKEFLEAVKNVKFRRLKIKGMRSMTTWDVVNNCEAHNLGVRRAAIKLKKSLSIGLKSEYRYKDTYEDPLEKIVKACENLIDHVNKCQESRKIEENKKEEYKQVSFTNERNIFKSDALEGLQNAFLEAVSSKQYENSFLSGNVKGYMSEQAGILGELKKDLESARYIWNNKIICKGHEEEIEKFLNAAVSDTNFKAAYDGHFKINKASANDDFKKCLLVMKKTAENLKKIMEETYCADNYIYNCCSEVIECVDNYNSALTNDREREVFSLYKDAIWDLARAFGSQAGNKYEGSFLTDDGIRSYMIKQHDMLEKLAHNRLDALGIDLDDYRGNNRIRQVYGKDD